MYELGLEILNELFRNGFEAYIVGGFPRDKYLGIERQQQEVNGFRVQVYASNQQQIAKNESILLQQEMEKKLSDPVYVISEPPFWKVRVGNFLTRDEANQHKESILELFPELQNSTYVVPDKIIILN